MFVFLPIFAPHYTTLIETNTTPHNFYVVYYKDMKKTVNRLE